MDLTNNSIKHKRQRDLPDYSLNCRIDGKSFENLCWLKISHESTQNRIISVHPNNAQWKKITEIIFFPCCFFKLLKCQILSKTVPLSTHVAVLINWNQIIDFFSTVYIRRYFTFTSQQQTRNRISFSARPRSTFFF